MNRTVLLAPLLSACVVGGGEVDWTFDDAAGARIELGNGSVEVTNGADNGVRVRWSGGGIGDAGIPTCDRDDDGVVTFSAAGVLGGGDVTVEVPPNLDVETFLDHGDLRMALDTPGDVIGCVGEGSAFFKVPSGAYDLRIEAAAADVDVSGVQDDPDAPTRLGACVGAGTLVIVGTDDDGSPAY